MWDVRATTNRTKTIQQQRMIHWMTERKNPTSKSALVSSSRLGTKPWTFENIFVVAPARCEVDKFHKINDVTAVYTHTIWLILDQICAVTCYAYYS